MPLDDAGKLVETWAMLDFVSEMRGLIIPWWSWVRFVAKKQSWTYPQLILLPQPAGMTGGYQHQAYDELGIEPGASYMLSKHSTSEATAPSLNLFFK